MTNGFKKYVEDQQEIRDRLLKVLKENPQGLSSLSKEIGVSLNTIFGFLRDEKNVDFIRLVKIEKWIKKHE